MKMEIKIAAGTPLPASFGRARGPSRAADPVGLEVPFEPHNGALGDRALPSDNGALGVTRPTLRNRALALYLCVSAVMFLLGLMACQAQSYSIDWHKIAGGGGTSSNSQYTVSGTIGQPDAGGPLTGGNYSLTGGFWALISVVQTPGAPTLTIVPAGPGQATISWTPASTNWVLQETLSLSPANWTNSPSGNTNPIVVPATPPKKFYRLFKP